MRTIVFLLAFGCTTVSLCQAQSAGAPNPDKARKDSLAHSRMRADSLRIEKLVAISQYPLIKGSKWSGSIPVADPTEIPDPNREYKLLFSLSAKNPDSLAGEINKGLDEVARVLNVHVASGIPANKLFPVVVINGPGLEALMKNESYRKKHSMDNPNLKIISDLESAGTKFIACGQAMAFQGTSKEDLLPEIKITLSAQTVLSNYQLQGYVLYTVRTDR